MDTKFSSAIHTLILIARAAAPMSSEQLAKSVGTNASYIRKLTTLMRKSGIIHSRRGSRGFSLARDPADISLLEVYLTVEEAGSIHLFDIHRNPNDACVVGRHIDPVLRGMFGDMEAQVERSLRAMSLQDCISHMEELAYGTERAAADEGSASE